MNYIKGYKEFNNTNESMKTWLTSFLLMSSLGIVPLSVKSQDTQSKKDFVESQPQDKIDAVSFFDYLKKFGNGRPITSVWEEFGEKNNPKSSLEDVSKYINQDGKNYYFEKDYQVVLVLVGKIFINLTIIFTIFRKICLNDSN